MFIDHWYYHFALKMLGFFFFFFQTFELMAAPVSLQHVWWRDVCLPQKFVLLKQDLKQT